MQNLIDLLLLLMFLIELPLLLVFDDAPFRAHCFQLLHLEDVDVALYAIVLFLEMLINIIHLQAFPPH